MIKGADVSRWQGKIDWDAFAPAVDFVIIKASGGDQGLYPDGQFSRNQSEARRLNKPRGYYHFMGNVAGGSREADHFVDTVGPLQSGESLVLDWEVQHPDPVGYVYDAAKRVIERTGVAPLIYMSESRVTAHDWQRVIDLGCGLWVAKYGVNDGQVPANRPTAGKWPFWAIWQYSSSGSFPGIGGRVDTNLFQGETIEQFLAYGKKDGQPAPQPAPNPAPAPAPEPPKPTGQSYTVNSGDTLSSIALHFGTTWQAIYDANRDKLSNPNRIFPGQVLTIPGGAPAPAPQARTYTVAAGDNLSSIAAKYGISWTSLYSLNKSVIGPNPNFIRVGQVLRLP